MSISKNPRFDLKRKRNRVLETGMILSLAFLIFAFKLFPEIEKAEPLEKEIPDIFDGEKITNTTQPPEIPPPPKPLTVIEAPDDFNMPDVPIENTEIDQRAKLDAPPPISEDKDDDLDDSPPFEWVEKMPAPIGGIEGIQKRIAYPDFAVRVGLEGKVYVRAFIDKKGNVYKVDIIKGIGGGCDEAAAAAVLNTKFYPGEQRGKPVKVMVSVPISFKLR
jgi:periplasmic protein TonB